MRLILTLSAATALALAAAPALAQDSQPATTPADAPAAKTDAQVAVGLAVKDKTGAEIGQVTDVKTDAAGKTTATIKMGAESFAVDTASLAVQDGAAVVNASQDELKAMMQKK